LEDCLATGGPVFQEQLFVAHPVETGKFGAGGLVIIRGSSIHHYELLTWRVRRI
jgi:hypothetical protein